MKHRSPFSIFPVVLCVVALMMAQMFGSKAGYYCECGSEPVPTQTSHCHGPHGETCHTDEAHGFGFHGEEESSQREDHQVVHLEVKWRLEQALPQVIAPQVLLAVLPRMDVLFSSREMPVTASGALDFGESPPFGIAVARTIVLRI